MSRHQPLCALTDIPESGSISLGETLFAVRRGNDVFLYRNNCPHDQIPLNWEPDRFLDASGTLIECANHGALFNIDTGECVAGPCIGDCLESVAFTLSDGHLYLK